MKRRKFISLSGLAGVSLILPASLFAEDYAAENEKGDIMSVNGKLDLAKAGTFLAHEHIITDFTGAEKIQQPQYSRKEAFAFFLPYLKALKQSGVNTIAECTPAYIGRDVLLLKSLSTASGLNIITNTGYYAAVDFKYLPAHVFTDSANQLAARWLEEWKNGIEGTGIRPGFIKLGVGAAPLKPIEQKLIKAAAQTHLQSGLKIAIHTGDGAAATEELALLTQEGIAPNALIWVHAQNDSSGKFHISLARKGCWISLDGVNATTESIAKYTGFLVNLKRENLLNKVLLSHDDGFAVNKKHHQVSFDAYQNGNAFPYQSLFTKLKPALLNAGISAEEFSTMTTRNPQQAFKIEVCKAVKQ